MELSDLILIPNLDNVVLINKSDGNSKSIDGTLCISSHHLLCSSRQDDRQELWVHFTMNSILLLYIIILNNMFITLE